MCHPEKLRDLHFICVAAKVGIEDSLCPRHLPIIAQTTIHFSQNPVTQLRILCLHLIKLHPNSGILARQGEKDRTYFIRKASHDYLRHSDQNASQLGDRKQKFFDSFGSWDRPPPHTHFVWGKKKNCMRANGNKQWNTQCWNCLLFYSSSMTFGFFLFFFIFIVLKVYSFPSLVPSSHWPINSENNERPRCSREVLSVWEVWRGWTCREHNQPDDKMSGHPTGFPNLLVWQIEGG